MCSATQCQTVGSLWSKPVHTLRSFERSAAAGWALPKSTRRVSVTEAAPSGSIGFGLLEERVYYAVVVLWPFFLQVMRRGVQDVKLPAQYHPRQHHRIIRLQEGVVHAPAEKSWAAYERKFPRQILPLATRVVRARGQS